MATATVAATDAALERTGLTGRLLTSYSLPRAAPVKLRRASAWPDRHRPEQSDRERLDTGKVRSLNLRSSGAPNHI